VVELSALIGYFADGHWLMNVAHTPGRLRGAPLQAFPCERRRRAAQKKQPPCGGCIKSLEGRRWET
jgi:hypothetical protein